MSTVLKQSVDEITSSLTPSNGVQFIHLQLQDAAIF